MRTPVCRMGDRLRYAELRSVQQNQSAAEAGGDVMLSIGGANNAPLAVPVRTLTI